MRRFGRQSIPDLILEGAELRLVGGSSISITVHRHVSDLAGAFTAIVGYDGRKST
jgi:hypothetical protein